MATNPNLTDREVALTVARRTVTIRQAVRQNQLPQATLTINRGGVTPLAALTPIRVNAVGSSDPDTGDSLTYSWNFGDGTTDTGLAPPPHVYQFSGTFAITLTVTDQLGATGTAAMNVVVKSMTGTWAATANNGATRTFVITQSGLALSGTYTNSFISGLVGTFTGSLTSPRTITFTATIEDPIMMTTSIAAVGDFFTGNLTRQNAPPTLNQTFRRIQ